mmetsp:Transcript_41378/g.67128  ORF Transcript_41378/g.67128 Transcript_41378/m.67128 type:complete len:152 (+) Transcript_41378:130-585(+)
MYDRLYFAQISQSMGTSLHEVRRSPLSYLKNGEVPPGVVSGQIPKKELKHFISVMTAYNSPPASLSGGTSPLNKRLPSIDDFYDTDLLEHFPGSSLSPTNHLNAERRQVLRDLEAFERNHLQLYKPRPVVRYSPKRERNVSFKLPQRKTSK